MASLLGKFRDDHNTVMAIDDDTPNSRPGAAIGPISFKVAPPDGGKSVLVVYPALSMPFYAMLGNIVARWPMLELYIDEMTKLLTTVTGGDPDMKGIYNAKRRLAYHNEQFGIAFAGHTDLIAYHAEVMTLVMRAKRIRDYVGHAQIIGQPTAEGFRVRFIDRTVRENTERKYSSDDLMKVASEISHATGFIEAIAMADEDVLPLPSRDISALRRVLGEGRWTAAIGRALKIQPQPSHR